MSVAAPEGGRQAPAKRGGLLGMPWWAWGIIAAAAVGTVVYLRLHSAGTAATSTSQDTSGGSSGDDTSLSEYEQISAQLTGIEGTDKALLAAIRDLHHHPKKKPQSHPDRPGKHHHKKHKPVTTADDDSAEPAQSPGSAADAQQQASAAADRKRSDSRAPRQRTPAKRRTVPRPRERTPARRAA